MIGPVRGRTCACTSRCAAVPDGARPLGGPLTPAGPTEPSYQDELRRSLADLLPTPPVAVPVHESDDAFVDRGGRRASCVCPWRTPAARLAGLGELRPRTSRSRCLDALTPGRVVRRQSAQDYERWLAAQPGRPAAGSATPPGRSRSTGSCWSPTRERGGPNRGGDGEGRPRAGAALPDADGAGPAAGGAGALGALREALDEGPLIDGLVDVGRWLEEFHPRSLVELDYGGLVRPAAR